jgi:hypothetical protein
MPHAVRIPIWGTIVLCGLGLAIMAIGVHGSEDERGAIRRAVRSPFADLQRRNARALCHDFTPAVSAQLAGGGGSSCEAQVGRIFALTTDAAEYPPPGRKTPYSKVEIVGVSQSGDRAAAVSIVPGEVAGRRRLELRMLSRRWEIATPTKLEMRSDCAHPLLSQSDCVYDMSLSFAGGLAP